MSAHDELDLHIQQQRGINLALVSIVRGLVLTTAAGKNLQQLSAFNDLLTGLQEHDRDNSDLEPAEKEIFNEVYETIRATLSDHIQEKYDQSEVAYANRQGQQQ